MIGRFSPQLIASVHDCEKYSSKAGLRNRLMGKWSRMRLLLWSVVTHSDIQPGARLGSNLALPHPNGVVIHENASVGNNCMIMQQVTIGMIGADGYPVIGDNVYIGAGAKILGNVKVANGARVGANAVVLRDVPSGATAVGIPARVIDGR